MQSVDHRAVLEVAEMTYTSGKDQVIPAALRAGVQSLTTTDRNGVHVPPAPATVDGIKSADTALHP